MIKHLTALTLALALATTAQADQKICTDLSELAEKYMTLRQQGVPMSDVMETAGDSRIIQGIVIDAYDSPRYSTERTKTRQRQDFRNDVYLECIKAFRSES